MYWHAPLEGLRRICLQIKHKNITCYWKFYFRQIPIDSTSAGVEYRLFVDDGGGIYAVFCECVESTFFTSRH